MPTYDYVCSSCGHRMEVMHGVHGHGPSACPVCGGQMRKAFAPPVVHFKGTGWAKKERSATGSKAKTSKGGAASRSDGSSGEAATGASPEADPKPAAGSSSEASAGKD